MSNDRFKIFYPGMRVKRWLFTVLSGVVVVGIGAGLTSKFDYFFVRVLGMLWILCGIVLIVMGVSKTIVSLLTLFLPKGEQDLVSILYQRRYLERGPKIVAIGGGHGLSHLLSGLKEYTSNITAIVTVADSGGSSGRLREAFDIVAPGDIRNCLVALADAPALMGELFQFRFSQESELKGHNFGNLFLTAMFQVTGRDFERAVKETSRVLAIRGKVVPSTVNNIHLVAEYEDGTVTRGEAHIPNPKSRVKRIYLTGEEAKPTQDALNAIAEADAIIMGPGSLYTSVIPNLIIEGMSEALVKSSAFKIYVCNMMTQHGESDSYTASDHLAAVVQHSDAKAVDACVLNNNLDAPEEALSRYKAQDSYSVQPDCDKIREMGYIAYATDLLSVTDYVRHDSKKLNRAIIKLIEQYRVIKR
ncbi:MAG: YvcK family protein [Candidatus Omnitrophica bacterium]|nr:YvcK family protein [Candidatus Omnitrophota bacterium]